MASFRPLSVRLRSPSSAIFRRHAWFAQETTGTFSIEGDPRLLHGAKERVKSLGEVLAPKASGWNWRPPSFLSLSPATRTVSKSSPSQMTRDAFGLHRPNPWG